MFEDFRSPGLLLHHWDTDGICSAALLLERLSHENIVNKTPEIGNYFLTPAELKRYAHYKTIVIVDMALPEEQILTLSSTASVMIFDHHLQQKIIGINHHNPISDGRSSDDYPSASWIVNEYLGNPLDLYALLGIIGDHEKRIEKNQRFYSLIAGFCQKNQLTFEQLLQMVCLLDSSYKIGDHKAVESIPRFLLSHPDTDSILTNPIWKNNLTLLEKEIKRLSQSPSDDHQGVLLKTIQTKYNIISTITRRISWEQKKDAIVINTGFFKDRDQIYIRSRKNLQPLIEWGKSQGFQCGGKTEVLGAVLLKEQTNDFVQEILRFLK